MVISTASSMIYFIEIFLNVKLGWNVQHIFDLVCVRVRVRVRVRMRMRMCIYLYLNT